MPEIELPNPHELEERREKSFTRRVALVTSVYAVALAIAALGGNSYGREMLLAQQKASDQWSFYQARSIREHQYRGQKLRLEADLVERGPAMREAARAKAEALLQRFADEEKRYNTTKEPIKAEAEKLEQERDRAEKRVFNFEFAEVFLQISIVLASVSILATSRPMFGVSLVAAVLGAVLTGNGFRLLFTLPFGH
ncbi:MAG: hypothetical protein DMD82_01390 [Candidatus Rokuibacteriota bacterium]|nr:MAG: hypothetical protein DMD82_01390 [Candidatus Rokubacteria bacterium]